MPLVSSSQERRENIIELPSSRTPRILWWLLYPPLTGDIIINAALDLGILQKLDSGKISLNKMNEPNLEQWLMLRQKCCEAIDIYDPETYEGTLVRNSPVYKKWKRDLKSWQSREGVRDVNEN